jgi:hypothetical protein
MLFSRSSASGNDGPQGGVKTQSVSPGTYQAVPNIFAAARGKDLNDTDLDSYIDSSVSGADRALAHTLMAVMPANMRGDFIYLRPGNRLVSNNPKLLKYVSISSLQPGTPSQGSGLHSIVPATSTRLHAMDYSSSCSPPNPPSNPGGAYVRQVSLCKFTAGWGFVNVPCGYSSFATNSAGYVDAGYLYMELQGSSGSLTEGGLQYNSDASIAPYLRTPGGFVTMNNNSVRYTCGENLGIVFGATQSGLYTYTAVGQVPATCSPQTAFCNGNAFTFQGQSWLFEQAAGDINGAGTDPVGDYTPCTNCSVSRVTSIAQNDVGTYDIDGSYFGVNLSSGQNMINWMQVAFGEWESNCVPGTTLCTFDYSTWPLNYYGGPQYYPDSNYSGSDVSGLLGYGPYESYDGINLSSTGDGYTRTAGSQFAEPLPPEACTPDSQNYCAAAQSYVTYTYQSCNSNGVVVQAMTSKTTPYDVLTSGRIFAGATSQTQHYTVSPLLRCQSLLASTSWSPWEPKTEYSDPNLP